MDVRLSFLGRPPSQSAIPWRRANFHDMVVPMTTEPVVIANPNLRHRLPLYPTQFLVAMAIVSIGPLLHPMMRDLGHRPI